MAIEYDAIGCRKGGLPVVARLELDWWQARREAVSPRDYGVTIWRCSDQASSAPRRWPVATPGGQAMAEQDWLEIEGRLLRAYQQLSTRSQRASGRSDVATGLANLATRHKKAPDEPGLLSC